MQMGAGGFLATDKATGSFREIVPAGGVVELSPVPSFSRHCLAISSI